MCSRSVSVVIPRPTADSNTYEPLDGDYIEQTWDAILSDESSFNSSFDDYSGSETIDGPYESTNEPPREHPGHASSPYFASQKPSKKHPVSKRQISKIGSESNDKSVENDTNTLITPNLVSSGRLILELETDHALDELEAKAFELVDADTHGRLVRYIAERPFFKRDEYPVKRSERREFVYDIRRAITDAELDEDTKERIIAYIKKLYLTACGRGHLCDSGSEYGEEIDDNPAGYSCNNPISSDNPRVLNPSKRKARNLKKRRLRKTRKASSADNLRNTAIDSQEHSQSIDIAVRKKSKPVTAANTSSESKYFKCRQKKDKKQKSVYDVNNEYHFNNKRALPEATRLILRELQLPPDFLSSDSTLSDVPSDDDSLDNSDYFLQATDPSPTELSAQCVEALHTPTNAAIAKPRLKLPKVSPYFFSPLFEPNSCLPFPAVDTPSFGLIQEKLAHTPFKLLIATIFLNRTRGGVALPVLFKVLDRYPTVEAMAAASLTDLVSMIHCLGFQNQRARKCIGLAQTWLACPPKKGRRYRKLHYPCKTDGRDIAEDECIEDDDPRMAWEIAHLPGVGAYSLDSWRIFCRDKLRGMANDWKGNGAMEHGFVPEWKSVLPQDKELRAYLTWMWLKEGWVWDRQTGKRTRGSEKVMRAARRGGVAHEENGNWVLETSPVKKVANGLTEAATGEGFEGF